MTEFFLFLILIVIFIAVLKLYGIQSAIKELNQQFRFFNTQPDSPKGEPAPRVAPPSRVAPPVNQPMVQQRQGPTVVRPTDPNQRWRGVPQPVLQQEAPPQTPPIIKPQEIIPNDTVPVINEPAIPIKEEIIAPPVLPVEEPVIKPADTPVTEEEKTEKQLEEAIRAMEVPKAEHTPEVVLPVTQEEVIAPAVPVVTETVEVNKANESLNVENTTQQSTVPTTPVSTIPTVKQPPVYAEPEPEKPGFIERFFIKNPDIEKFIGENLINKIGIAILVLGIAYFVKYAIDKDWINETGRVAIGIFCGAVLIGVAHWVSKNYRSFSSVLAGGGIAIFYFTIAFAFQKYHLFDQTPAFIIMVVITIFAVVLSMLYDRIELAVIATLGGFLAPFLVSRGDGNYVVLFTYLAILNAGLIVLAKYKKWRLLNIIALFFTVLIYGGWIMKYSDTKDFSFTGTFLFGTVFYLMFIAMNLLNQFERNSKIRAFDIISLLSLNLLYYSAGFYLLTNGNMPQLKGLFTAALGLLNLVLAYSLYKNDKVDRNFIYLLIGLTLSFISLAAPVQLKGNYITLFWASEMVLLCWLSQKVNIRLIKVATAIVTGLVVISLVMDWNSIYNNYHDSESLVPVIFNKGCITSLVVSVAMFLVFGILNKAPKDEEIFGFTNSFLKIAYVVMGSLILLVAGCLEINEQFTKRFPGMGLEVIYWNLYIICFISILYLFLRYFKITINRNLYYFVPAFMALYFILINTKVYNIEIAMLENAKNKIHFVAHWISIILLLTMINTLIRRELENKEHFKNIVKPFATIVTLVLVVILSIEMQHLYVWLHYSFNSHKSIELAESIFAKAGLSILWGVMSFIIIWLGLNKGSKVLRILGLLLFGITILKLFVYDLRNISQGGKIASFILLGVLLLVISFMYQRLKKFIIDDKPKENNLPENE